MSQRRSTEDRQRPSARDGRPLHKMAVIRCGALSLLLVALWCHGTQGHDLLRPQLAKKRSSHFCGAELINMLLLVCDAYGVGPGKRSSVGFSDAIRAEATPDRLRVPMSPLGALVLQRPGLASRLHPSRDPLPLAEQRPLFAAPGTRVKRQIVDECCVQACDIQTLRSYCDV
ncbi:uncharacterized protein LOC119092352 [Pollicipes pollicipes]|uniref:uncharacterized protein LOC119092352 n=1 Tax=Pollicipes pollicipes TaxID=41117 RepID=UPI001884ED65|nr:uncharacterized protein LOC119092352 [Pollicipes pollicipes]